MYNMELYVDIPPPPIQINRFVLWKCNVDRILKHNQKGSMLGKVRYIIYSTNMIRLVTSHEEVSWPLTLRQEIPNIHISNWAY